MTRVELRQQDAATQTLRRLDRFMREIIAPAEVADRAPLSVYASVVGGEPIPFDEAKQRDFTLLRPGTLWGRAWDTVWLHVTGNVPAGWTSVYRETRNLTLALEVDLGFTTTQSGFQAEGLLHDSSGRVLRALSPRNHRMPLEVEDGEATEFFVEAAANPTLNSPDGTGLIPLAHRGSWESAGEDLLYRFAGASLILQDADVQALLLDVQVLRELVDQPETTRRRREKILAALEDMLAVVDPLAVSKTAALGRERLAPALAAPASASAMTLTAVGHAHIDSAWLWPLRETVRKCARTFSNVVTLMDQDPDLVFACSSAQQFKWMKDLYPDLYLRIKEKVVEGRFVPVGGMWVEADTQMPSGEALARQFIAGQNFFREEFGLTCDEVWLPDSFGYSGALPQIARQGGTKWFFGQKMSWNRTNRMPHHTFDWEGIDGTRIFTHFTPVDSYNTELSVTELAYAERNFEDHQKFSGAIVPFGFGDGGGGPTKRMLEAGRRAANVEGLPRLQFGSPADFFAHAENESTSRATWVGEMYLELHRGTYSAQARTKQGNRRNERLLREAELWATTAYIRCGLEYPQAELRDLWERTLLLQFHDILPGTSISWVHQDAERMHAENADRLKAIIDRSMECLAGEGEERLVVNSSPFTQMGVPPHSAVTAAALPETAEVFQSESSVTLKNSELELHISPEGTFTGLISAASGVDYLHPAVPANQLHIHQDIPTDWDAWDIDEHYRRLKLDLPQPCEIEVLESSVKITRKLGESTVTQSIRLNVDSVDIETEVDWHESQRLLKLAFPLRVEARESSAETQFGYVNRPIHENTSWDEARFEIVAHRWLHVTDGLRGAAVVNDTTYGHDVTRVVDPSGDGAQYLTQIRQTLVRGPKYPDPESDQGKHSFATRLVVDAGLDTAVRHAYTLASPNHEVRGANLEIAPVASAAGTGVVLETVKLAEDGSGDVILRVYESLGQPTSGEVRIDADRVWAVNLLEDPMDKSLQLVGNAVQFDLRAFEILTLRASGAR